MNRERTIHLIDIENFVDKNNFTTKNIDIILDDYKKVVNFKKNDLVIIACDRGRAKHVMFTKHNIRLIQGEGKSGADIALSKIVLEENLEKKFDNCFIASGDGHFLRTIFFLKDNGVHVTLVSRWKCLNKAFIGKKIKIILIKDRFKKTN